MKNTKISIIIPSYNEEAHIEAIIKACSDEMNQLDYLYEILIIDDGSTDRTSFLLKELALEYHALRYVSFSRNFGKEAAILAGLRSASGDAVIFMDADLQHPPSMIASLIEGYEEGYDQVIAKRDRQGDSKLKTLLSKMYYRMVNKAVDVKLSDGEGDFRLLSRRSVDALLSLNEGNRFSKGLYAWIGYEQKIISYKNQPRQHGESKWSIAQLLNYGIDGIVSFNHKPLRICFYLGFSILMLSIMYIVTHFIWIIKNGVSVPGYFTIVSSVLFLGGIQLVALGIIGEYIGRIYYETKRRPQYLIKQENIERGVSNVRQSKEHTII